MLNQLNGMDLKMRGVFGFLLVPWLPIFIFVPYAPANGTFRLFGWDYFGRHLGLCVVLALFTYVLEIAVLIPIWLVMLRKGKTSFISNVTAGFLVALTLSLVFLTFLSWDAWLHESDLMGLIPLICSIGTTEAAVFWLIVRPDRRDRAERATKSQD